MNSCGAADFADAWLIHKFSLQYTFLPFSFNVAAVRLLQLIRKKNRGRPAVKNKSAKEKHTPYYGVCFICGGLPLVGLSEINSKNYAIVAKYVKDYASAPEKSEIDPEITDLSYDPNSIIKTIKQQQKHEFSKKEIEEIISAYRSGVSTYELAEQYNCHRSTISHQLKMYGIEVKIEKIDIDEAIALYESGWTTKQIAEKYHMTDNAVSRRLKKAGVKMRTRWDY